MPFPIIPAVIALVSAGVQGGMSASASKKATSRTNQIANRQADINEADRDFALKTAKQDMASAKQQFEHQKKIDKTQMAFTKQDVDRQARDTNTQLKDSFSSNILKLGAEDTIGDRESDKLRLGSM